MPRDVRKWLEDLGLGKYVEVFLANDVDLDVLRDLDESDLERLGLSLGHRKKVLRAIAELDALPTAESRPAQPIRKASKPLPAVAERRQLTVMFIDLVGSTELSHRLDPEEMREVMRAYQDLIAGEVARFDGHIAKFMGDGVLTYFGWPQAHEDEAERAARAGLAVVRAISRLRTPAGQSLAVRVGIATGLVVVGDLVGEGATQEGAVVGDTPNLASRLQAIAEPGSIVIAAATRQQIGDLFELADLGSHQMKGFDEPIRVWRVERESTTQNRFEALHGQRLTALVGREHEIGLLLERFERAKDGEGQVVLLSGEPGIGKSRIVRALRERLQGQPYVSLSYFCSPFHVNSALYPLISLMERAARFQRDDSPETKLDKLKTLLAQSTANVDEVVPLVAALLMVPTGERYPPLGLTPEGQKQRTLEVLVDQLAGLAAKQPVLAVYEDVHWIDPSTLEFLELVVERAQRLPVLAIMTFRPEFAPPWAGRTHVTSLALGRLAQRQGASIIEALTRGKTLPPQVVQQIVTKTDGIPLFIEELTKTLLESGLLREAGDRYVLNGPLPPTAIPTTLHDSLLARLDRLGSAKETAQIGAALGREFSYELLAAVMRLPDSELHDALSQLTSADLVLRRGRPPHATYTFKHALIQDAAYATLLKSRRHQLHSRIAQVLAERFPERAVAEPELLAHHYTEAGATEQAIDQWLRAGQRAGERSSNVEAVAHLRRGLQLLETLPDTVGRARRELDLQIALGMPLLATKGYAAPETGAAHDRARELCDQVGNPSQLLPILYGQIVFRISHGQLRSGRRLAEEFLRSAQEQGAEGPALVARRMIGISLILHGELPSGRSRMEQALALYDTARHRSLAFQYGADQQSTCLAWLSFDLSLLGYPEQAERAGRNAIALAKEIAHAITMAHALRYGGCFSCIVRQDPRTAREHATALNQYAERQRLPFWSALAKFILAWTSVETGRSRAAVTQMRATLAEIDATGHRLDRPLFLAMLAAGHGGIEQAAEGLRLLDEALAQVEETDERWWEPEIHRLKGEMLLSLSAENVAVAEACYERAISVARRQCAKLLELRAGTSLARLWQSRGRSNEAGALLAPIYGWFTEGFDSADLKEAKASLEGLAGANATKS